MNIDINVHIKNMFICFELFSFLKLPISLKNLKKILDIKTAYNHSNVLFNNLFEFEDMFEYFNHVYNIETEH